MYKTFTLPLKSAFALATLFILTACGGFTIDINSLGQDGECSANPFLTECDNQRNISTIRQLVIDDCDSNPEKSNTRLCLAADAAFGARDAGGAADNTPKDILIKSEFDKNGLTKTDDEKIGIADLEIVDLCSDPATAHDKQCTLAVIDCINNPFSGSCQGDNVLGNFVRGTVTVSKTVILQDKRAEDCRTGSIDRALCQNLSVQKQRCAGAAFSTDAICSAVAYSVCKADAFDPLCGEKENFAGVYFNERSEVCYAEPNNPNCTGLNGHVAVVCSEYPFDRLCTGNTDYDDARADACEADPSVSLDCPFVPVADVCLDNPFGPTCADSDYNNARKELVKTCIIQTFSGGVTSACDVIIAATGPCFKNPFDTTCDANPAVRSYIGQLRSNRVALCNSNLRVASYCTGVPVATPQVTASVWANSFTTPLATEATVDHLYNTESQFLIGRATDLDSGDVPSNIIRTSGNLNLADATFNGVALGGDAADGLAFLTDGALYSGILSGTNLGAPLTNTVGTAKWIGSFQLAGYSPTDFVLNVSFGTGSGAGEIEALIQSYIYFSDHHIKGEFDDAGVITGTADTGFYRRNDPTNRREDVTNHYSPGKLTGLIGEEGAVGAFIIDNLYGVGGFVARPSSVAELQTLAQTCADDPFNKLCSIGYESERNAVLDHCIIGGNANDESCDSANDLDSCIKHPFRSSCEARLPDHYQQVRVNRLAFCRTEGNAGNELCTADTTFAHICTNYPFDAQCLGNDDYDQARQDACDTAGAGSTECRTLAGITCSNDPFDARCDSGYNNARESACASNPNSSRCSDTLARVCGGNPFDPLCGSGYTQNRRTLCTDDPFAPRCAGEGYNDLRVDFCQDNAGTHPSCPAPQVTAKVWADSFDTPLSHGATAEDTESQFLIGRATDLDTGGVRRHNPYNSPDNLNLADATFNGVALGGDRADGVAFFGTARSSYARGIYSYAGILEGTNLGAPLTDTQGSAKWIGSFKIEGITPTDFVLNISFGTGDGAGEVEALIPRYFSDFYSDYYIAGEFDDAGVIMGTVRYRVLGTSSPADAQTNDTTGKLTGLIGEEGAVGAFIIDDYVAGDDGDYYGGFVARPSTEAELRTLEQTCTDDPFNRLCTVKYESQRNAIIEHCIIGGNANDNVRCRSVKQLHICINNPFRSDCDVRLPQYYEQARANRITFCRTVGNADNALCTVTETFAHICTNHPFDAQCLGNNIYRLLRRVECLIEPFATRCAGDAYNDLRVTFCENNAGNPDCPTPQVTASVWENSFDEELETTITRDSTSSKFLKARATDLDNGAVRSFGTLQNGLNLADATFNGVALGGDAADGAAFFAANFASDWGLYSYAGILSGTNLGAPLTDTIGTAKWVGSFLREGNYATDFVLNVSFGTGAGAGEIEALVQEYSNYDNHNDYHIAGEFDDTGVITGTALRGAFRTNDPDNRGEIHTTGTLTGLIGEEGAVGAFLIGNHFGGFVARPSSVAELRTLTETCADDPFNGFCNLGYETQRDAVIDHCIIGGNANDESCGSANELYSCINNPFSSDCDERFSQHYEQTRANRVAFCRTAGNAGNALCTVEATFAHICTNHPFDAQCLGDSNYTPLRRIACTDDPFAPRCAGARYNGLRVIFCDRAVNANNPSCPAQVLSDTTPNRVTTTDWLEGFDDELPSQPDANNLESGFLEATADDLNSGTLGNSPYYRHTRSGVIMYNLNFDTASYDGKYLNGDARDGVAFFEGNPYQGAGSFAYAGILAGTDLGAPLNQTGRATWHGSINETSWYSKNTDFSLDIEFNGTAGGTIEGFAASPYNGSREENYYLRLRGSFDSNGVITGTTNKGRFTDDNPDLPRPGKYSGRILFGTLTGLIGEEGAVGAFVQGSYAGGFVVRPSAAFDSPEPLVNNARVTTADWLNSFNEAPPVRRRIPAGSIGSYNPAKNHFVKASKTGLSLQNYDRTSYKAVTFANAIFDGKAVGGDAADGFALSSNPSHYTTHHAGILSGTDLGSPLTQTQGSAAWEGRMIVFGAWAGSAVFTDFVLHINFGAGSQVGTVTGQVKTTGPGDADYKYRVDGDFNEAGVIKGTAEYGNFNYEDTKIPRYWRKPGTLTGLIGEEGAVGVFISDRTGYAGYVGGFIAAPSLQDHVTSADLKDYYHLAFPTDPLYRNETSIFLAASSTGEMNTSTLLTRDGSTPTVETLTLANATHQGRGLGGDATDGISFFKGWKGPTDTSRSSKIHYRVYSGIFNDINLGAPVTQTSGKAYWKGQFKSVHFDRVVSKDFTLEVSFSDSLRRAGRVDALVHDTGLKHFAVSATFNHRGVIDGSITFGDYENNVQSGTYASYRRGDLVGLIGQEGALAIFKSNTPYGSRGIKRETDFAGGFAVVPNLPDLPKPAPDTTPNRVTAEDWVASFETAPALVNNPNNHHFMQFPRRRVGGIEGIVLFANVLGFERLNQTTLTLDDDIFQDGGGDAADGIFFVRANRSTDSDESDSYFYAGIIPETDLGAPLSETSGTATWSGRFNAVISGSVLRYFSRDFTLGITFNATGGDINTIVSGRTEDYFELDGTFNNRGVISGTANHVYYENGRIGNVTGDIVNSGPVTGLIGQEGAVGAFFSNRQTGNTSGFAGGFVARPPSE